MNNYIKINFKIMETSVNCILIDIHVKYYYKAIQILQIKENYILKIDINTTMDFAKKNNERFRNDGVLGLFCAHCLG